MKIKYNKDVLEHLEQKTPLTDSLKLSYRKLIGRGTFEPMTVAYENLKSKGIDIIQNDSLRIAISELYDFKYFYITQDLRSDYESVKVLHESEVFKNVKTINIDGQTWAEPVKLTKAQNNTYFQEALKRDLGFYDYMNKDPVAPNNDKYCTELSQKVQELKGKPQRHYAAQKRYEAECKF